MTNVAEELTTEGLLSREHVAKRVRDWKSRIAELYAAVEEWLPEDVVADRSNSIPMNENLMREFKVPSTKLPVLTMMRNNQWQGKLVPQGLWIIGSNGRIDLFTNHGQAIIVDRGENFGSPNWLIASSSQRRQTKPLTSDTFRAALGL